MKKICKKIYIAATVIMVLIMFCTILFWARLAVLGCIFAYIPQEVEISPSGLTPDLDANTPSKIQFQTSLRNPAILGFTDIAVNAQFRDKIFLTPMILDHSKGSDIWQVIYYDKNLRLFVECRIDRTRNGLETSYKNTILSYIGTDGVCKKNDNDKKFGKLLFGNFFCSDLTFFDKISRRFYRIAFNENNKIYQGPVLDASFGDIVQIGAISKNEYLVGGLKFNSSSQEESPTKENKFIFATPFTYGPMAMNSDGRVFLVKNNDLTIKTTGQIADIYASQLKPINLFAYSFQVLKRNEEIKGAVLTGISTTLYCPYMIVFDANGTMIQQKGVEVASKGIPLESMPWSFVARYFIENLLPWGFGMATCYTADKFDSAYMSRGLFILPDSYVAYCGRTPNEMSPIGRFFAVAFVVLLPSLLIGLVLGIRVYIKSGRAGLAKSERKAWLFTVLLLGIPGYIGYKLTNPRQIQVTCKNCGKGRRPDMDSCHNCGASWNLDELDPPKWSVFTETA
jgi:hypothetical protein